MTVASALPLLILGALGLLAFFAMSFGATASDFSGWPVLPLPLAAFLFAESAIRMGIAFLQEEPVGSLAGTLLYEAWDRLTGGRRAGGRGYAFGREPAPGEAGEEDR
jgi:hypothetical protein